MANYKAQETVDLATANFTWIRYKRNLHSNVIYGNTGYRLTRFISVKIKARDFAVKSNEPRHVKIVTQLHFSV